MRSTELKVRIDDERNAQRVLRGRGDDLKRHGKKANKLQGNMVT